MKPLNQTDRKLILELVDAELNALNRLESDFHTDQSLERLEALRDKLTE